jgi:hypothetical protein
MSYYKNTIAANGRWDIQDAGEFFRLMDTDGAVNVTLFKNGSLQNRIENVQAGLWRRGEFDWVRIEDATGSANNVEVVIDNQDVGYDRGAANVSIIGTPNVSIVGNGVTHTQTAATVTNASAQLVAANSARKYLMIQNNGGGDIFLNFSGAAATTGNGVKLMPGMSWESGFYVPRAAVQAIGSIASNPNVIVVEG